MQKEIEQHNQFTQYDYEEMERSVQSGEPAPDVLPKKEDKEMVNHPDHYNTTPVETMEMFLLAFHDRPDMIKGALLFNIMKYRDRAEHKNGKEDIDKMNWYLNRFEELFEEDAKLFRYYNINKS